jgi:hypothetical protein
MSCLIAADPAEAHPHVFIDNRVTFVFDAGKVTALRLHWVFDDIFSDDLLARAPCRTSSCSTTSPISGWTASSSTRSIRPTSSPAPMASAS